MSIKVGINGFGRIGRVALRVLMERGDQFEVCGINIRNADIPHMIYMIKYDSVFGRLAGCVELWDEGLLIKGNNILVFR